MKTLLFLLISTACFAQEKLLVQMQVDKVCVNQDTCFAVLNAHIVLTDKHLYIKDSESKLEAEVRMLEKKNEYYYAYATNDELEAYVFIDGPKVQIDYSFDGKRFLLDYHLKHINGKPLIKYF